MIGRLRKYATDIETLPGDAAAAWRSAGAAGVLTELRRRTVDRAGGYVCNLVIEAHFSGLRPISPPAGVEILPFGSTSWGLLGDLAGRRVAPVFAAASRAGRSCLVAWRGSRAVGYIWLSPAAEARYENFMLPLPPDANYLWQLQVARSERRQGVGAALVSAGLQWSVAQGLCRSWMITGHDNIAAQNTIASLAPCLVLGTISRVKVGSWMRSRYVPLAYPRPLQPRDTA